MPDIPDLGAAPAETECAQLGQTINFVAVNSFEVDAYRLAIKTNIILIPAIVALLPADPERRSASAID